LVVSGSSDKTVRVWDVETGQIIASPFEGHTSLVRTVTFSPDNKQVLSSSPDKTIRIWDIATGQVAIGCFDGHTSTLDYVAFSHDSKSAVAGFSDNIIKTLDVETGKVTGTFEGSPSRVSSIAYSCNGKWVISGGSTDKGIRIWDVETCQVAIGPFEGHTSYVTAVAFSPDCKRIVSGAADSTIRIWDVEAGRKADRLCNGRGYSLDEKSGWAYTTDPGCTERSALFWVPQAFRDGLCDNITLVFIGKRSIWLDSSQFVHGESWTQCYSHVSESLDLPTSCGSLLCTTQRYKPLVETSSSRGGYDLKRKDPPSPCSPKEQDFQRNDGSAQQGRIKMQKNSSHL
jgi:WD40 repeat protein